MVIQRDESVESNTPGSSETFYLEPPLFLKPVTTPLSGLPNWIHEIDRAEDGTVRVMVRVVLKSDELQDAAASLIRVAEADYLKRRSQSRNGGEPLQVVVRPMPITKIRLELVDLSSLTHDVLAFGDADVSRTPAEKEIWLHLEPAAFSMILKLNDKKNWLGMRPYYSYPHIAMSKASLLNFGESELRDGLRVWLKSRNLSGDGDISQQDIDEFARTMHVQTGSRIVAENPDAAGFLTNNITALAGLIFEPAEKIPFVIGGSQADEQKMAEHLGPLGWVKTTSGTYESVLENSQADISSTQKQLGTAGSVGNGKLGLGVKFGFGSTDEQVRATTQRSGIIMQQLDNKQGWMPALIQKYRVKQHAAEFGVY